MLSSLQIVILLVLCSISTCYITIPLHLKPKIRYNQRSLSGSTEDALPFTNFVGSGVYTGEVQIGTPPQNFDIIFDTGFSDLLVYSIDCANCNASYFYNFSASTSATDEFSTISLQYQTDKIIDANFYEDNITLGGYNVKGEFLVSNQSLSTSFPNGIFGLGLPSISAGNLTSIFHLIAESQKLDQIFSIYLSPSQSGSSLLFGGYNSSLSSQSFKYYPLTSSESWQIGISDFGLGGRSFKGDSTNLQAVFTSATPVIAGSYGLFKNLLTLLPANISCSEAQTYPNLYFTFGNDVYVISPDTYYLNIGTETCSLLIMDAVTAGYQIPPSQVWLGVPFFESYYTLFDMQNKTIGFAPPVQPPTPVPLAGFNYGLNISIIFIYIFCVIFV